MASTPKEKYNLIPTERETIVNFNEGEKECSIYTYNRRWKKKIYELWLSDKTLVKFGYLNAFKTKEPTEDQVAAVVEDSQECLDVIIPTWKWVKFAGPSKRKPLTEEQKRAAAERLAAGRAKAQAKDVSDDDPDEEDDEEDDE